MLRLQVQTAAHWPLTMQALATKANPQWYMHAIRRHCMQRSSALDSEEAQELPHQSVDSNMFRQMQVALGRVM